MVSEFLVRRPTAWSSRDGVAKMEAYTRWSAVLSTPMCLLAIVMAFRGRWDDSSVAVAGTIAVTVLLSALAMVGLAREGSLMLSPAPTFPRVARVSLALTALAWLVSLGVLGLGPDSARLFGAALALFCVNLFAYTHAPLLQYRWLTLTAAIAATLAVTGLPADLLLAATWILLPYFLLAIMLAVLWNVTILREVQRARDLEAELKVGEERLRIAQELHDTMGQHLAAMSLKTQLALALVERGDERAAEELRELQDLMKLSSSQMRDVVHGYRRINLATEIEGARSLLGASGIEVRVSGDSLDVPAPYRENAAWVVREAATNIVRHSQAASASIEVTPGFIRIANDGATEPPRRLSGLAELARTARKHGHTLTIEHDAPTFIVTLDFGSAPIQGGALA